MKRILLITISIMLFSCGENNGKVSKAYECPMQCENSASNEPGSCPVCKMDLVAKEILDEEIVMPEVSEESIYLLDSDWKTQHNEDFKLEDLKGKIPVVAMVFTSCEYACPLIVSDLKQIEQNLSPEAKEQVVFLLVSINPTYDTPEKLKEFSQTKKIEGTNWTLLNGDPDDVMTLAAVLNIKYKKVGENNFSHSNRITVLNKKGEIHFNQEGLQQGSDEIIKKINTLL
jgi:protein SCO1/2